MILDGISYSVFIQHCRVILSRIDEPYLLWLVFNLTLSGLDVCLDWYLRPPVFPAML